MANTFTSFERTPQSKLAYERAQLALELAYKQGKDGQPMHGEVLLFSETSDDVCRAWGSKVNAFREEYQRGLETYSRSA